MTVAGVAFALYLATASVCMVIVVACLISVIRDERRKARAAREAKLIAEAMIEEKRVKLRALPKGKIHRVGFVTEIRPGVVLVDDWAVDYPDPAIRTFNGEFIWCGYSVDELKEIVARKSEFEP